MFSKIPSSTPDTGKQKFFKSAGTFVLLAVINGKVQELARYSYTSSRVRFTIAVKESTQTQTSHFTKYNGGDHYGALRQVLQQIGFEFVECIRYDPRTVLLSIATEFFNVDGYVLFVE